MNRLGVPMEVPEDPVELVKVFRVLVETLRRGVLPFLGTSYRTVNGKVYGPYYEARWKPRKGEPGRTIYLGKEDSESVQFLKEWLETIRIAAPTLTEQRLAKWFVTKAVRRALIPVLKRLSERLSEVDDREEMLQEIAEELGTAVEKVDNMFQSMEFIMDRGIGRPKTEYVEELIQELPEEIREMIEPWTPKESYKYAGMQIPKMATNGGTKEKTGTSIEDWRKPAVSLMALFDIDISTAKFYPVTINISDQDPPADEYVTVDRDVMYTGWLKEAVNWDFENLVTVPVIRYNFQSDKNKIIAIKASNPEEALWKLKKVDEHLDTPSYYIEKAIDRLKKIVEEEKRKQKHEEEKKRWEKKKHEEKHEKKEQEQQEETEEQEEQEEKQDIVEEIIKKLKEEPVADIEDAYYAAVTIAEEMGLDNPEEVANRAVDRALKEGIITW